MRKFIHTPLHAVISRFVVGSLLVGGISVSNAQTSDEAIEEVDPEEIPEELPGLFPEDIPEQ